MKDMRSGFDLGKINILVVHNIDQEVPMAFDLSVGSSLQTSSLIAAYSPGVFCDNYDVDGVMHIFPRGNC